MYAEVDGEPFPIPALDFSGIDPTYLRKVAYFPTSEAPGTIVIDPQNHFLYLVLEGGRALRYGVGVGRESRSAGSQSSKIPKVTERLVPVYSPTVAVDWAVRSTEAVGPT